LQSPLDHEENESIFRFVFVLTMGPERLTELTRKESQDMPYLAETSEAHREKIIRWLQVRVQVQKKMYPGKLEDDVSLLASLPRDSMKALALRFRIIERRLLQKLLSELEDPASMTVFDKFEDTRSLRSPMKD
jgi:hypothetical protein